METKLRLHRFVNSLVTLAVALAILAAAPGRAELAIGGKAGTLGAGVELTAALSRQLNVRLGANAFDVSQRRAASGIEYDGEASLRSGTGLLDWHPGGGGFRLSAGLVYNDSRLQGRSVPPPSGVYDLGGIPVPVSLVGTLDATAELDPLVPYAGLGWGNAVATGRRWRVSLELGVIFQGEAEVTLTPNLPAGSPIHTTPGARQALDLLLRREERELADEVADYDLYPVLSLGVSYRL